MKTPNKQNSFPVPDLDLGETYIATLTRIEQRDNVDAAPRYTNTGRQVSNVKVLWFFSLATLENPQEEILDPGKGTPFLVVASTSDSTSWDPTGAMTSRARNYIHALSGKVLTDAQVEDMLYVDAEHDANPDHALPYGLLGKTAYATLSSFTRQNGDPGFGIQTLERIVKGRKAPPETEPEDDEEPPF